MDGSDLGGAPLKIDLRSDTVTQPTARMRGAMSRAEVGDDVFGDDPTVRELEDRVAAIVGKSASVFVPSGTQSNLCALMAHCQRGEEYIVSMDAHTYRYEAGGGAVLGSIQPQPIEPEPDATMSLAKIRRAIKPDDSHFAITRLICLENTTGGRALSISYMDDVCDLARENGLSLHLDGARLFNASVALGLDVGRLAERFDTVSICLSKGLGAPAGSVLSGTEELIAKARRWRKMLGGTMRQSGVLAAAGLHALDHHVERLAEDHDRARALADGLRTIEALHVDPDVETNMVFVEVPEGSHRRLEPWLRERGVLVYAPNESLRLVTHLGIDDEDIAKTLELFATFYG